VAVDSDALRAGEIVPGAGGPERAGAPGEKGQSVRFPAPGVPPLMRPTSNAPEQIEFVPQEPTRWLVPKLLVLIGVQVALSTKFAEFFDRRDAHTGVVASRLPDATQSGADHTGGNRWSLVETVGGYDFTGTEELWLDYVSDSGDGFDATTTIAALVARETLTLSGPTGEHFTRAGAVLVLGGDQAYPFATMAEYRNRLVGPFRSMLPWTWHPRWLFAIPGNHDWYDGLASFVKQFCQGRWIGGWKTGQTRSYFALALPHNWHLWAVDVALGTDIDTGQLDYFEERARALEPGAQIVLCAAKPTWTAAGHDPTAQDVLEYFRRTVIGARAELRLTLSGDLHLYARYSSADGESKIVAGGGGAYLSPTHHLKNPDRPPAPELPEAGPQEQPEVFGLERVFPTAGESRRLRRRIFGQIYHNRGFFLVTAAVYGLVAMAVPADRVFDRLTGRWLEAVAALLPVTLMALGLFAALYAFTAGSQASPRRKRAMAVLHTVLHLGVVIGVVDLLLHISGVAAADPWMRAVLGGAVGALFGPLIVAAYLWMADHWHVNSNELYAACANEAYKNFIRLRVNRDGLTVYPVGVRLPARWVFDRNLTGNAPTDLQERGKWVGRPWFQPTEEIRFELIENPIHIPAQLHPSHVIGRDG
jgi:hypothetical protein